MKRFAGIAAIAAAAVVFSACEAAPIKSEEHFFAMDTFMSVEAYGENSAKAAKEARERVCGLEKLWSVTDAGSELFALNHGETASVSRETAELAEFSAEISRLTEGAFDPTIYPVLSAWGFTTGEYRVPGGEEITELLAKTGFENVVIGGDNISLPEGFMLDFGGIAKGAASDECAAIMRENGISSALINLGGNIYAVGKRSDGELWKIGVADPLGGENVGILRVSDCAAVTSGGYERSFTENGVTYCHIIDPKTGRPVDNDLLSVTVISEEGRLCDALSTALYVMGLEGAKDFWRGHDGFELVLIGRDGEIYVTEGVSGRFSPSGNRGVNIIMRG